MLSLRDILNERLIAGMDVIGERMVNGDMFIPEVLMATKAMGGVLEILNPLPSEQNISAKAKVVIGTVQGDLHDIGKNLVAMMLKSAGFEVHDLGVDASPDKFVEAIIVKNAKMLCLSTPLTTTMPMIRETIDAVTEKGIRGRG